MRKKPAKKPASGFRQNRSLAGPANHSGQHRPTISKSLINKDFVSDKNQPGQRGILALSCLAGWSLSLGIAKPAKRKDGTK